MVPDPARRADPHRADPHRADPAAGSGFCDKVYNIDNVFERLFNDFNVKADHALMQVGCLIRFNYDTPRIRRTGKHGRCPRFLVSVHC